MSDPSTVVVHLSRSTQLTMNMRDHWATKARLVAAIRARFKLAARHMQPVTGPVVRHVEVAHHRADRRRDAENWAPTVKAGTDGLVDAGVLPDDSNAVVVESRWRGVVDPAVRPGTVRITLRFEPVGGGSDATD